MQLKVCGLIQSDNILDIIQLNPDFIGFIFYKKSKRYAAEYLDADFARQIPETVKKTGVFVNATFTEIKDTSNKYELHFAQLHGDETPTYCKQIRELGLGVIKAFNVDEDFNFKNLTIFEDACDYFLFDAAGKERGGNGVKFNWNKLKEYQLDTPFLLSGGIAPEDIDSITEISDLPQFKGVDINSKFEIKLGLKDVNKVKSFVSKLRR